MFWFWYAAWILDTNKLGDIFIRQKVYSDLAQDMELKDKKGHEKISILDKPRE